MKNYRILTYDVMRSISVVWIICFWHLKDYYDGSMFERMVSLRYGEEFTVIALASFTLLSGLFMGRYVIKDINDVKLFYKRRWIRFYLLYLFASLLLYFIPNIFPFYIDYCQLVFSLVGISFFYGSLPSTMWFMVMMMVFYAITPLIIAFKGRKRIVICLMLWLICYPAYKYGVIHLFIFRYTFFYLLGLCMVAPNIPIEFLKSNWLIKFPLMCVLFFVTFFFQHWTIRNYHILFGVFIALYICIALSLIQNSFVMRFVGTISMSSMCAYLFHRQIYGVFILTGMPAYLAIPFIFLFSFYLQILYDKLISRI